MGASGSTFGTVRAQNHPRDVFHSVDAKVVTKPEVHVSNNWQRFDAEGNLVDETSRNLVAGLVRVAAEDLRRDPELQWDQAGEPERGHPMGALGCHGLIIAVNGPRATVDLLAMSIRWRP